MEMDVPTIDETRKIPAYPLARKAAGIIRPHFELHGGFTLPDEEFAPVPDAATMEEMIDAAFWASLRREEGIAPRISVAYVAPEQTPTPVMLERPLPFTAQFLTRVAPAVERPGIHLGVWRGAE